MFIDWLHARQTLFVLAHVCSAMSNTAHCIKHWSNTLTVAARLSFNRCSFVFFRALWQITPIPPLPPAWKSHSHLFYSPLLSGLAVVCVSCGFLVGMRAVSLTITHSFCTYFISCCAASLSIFLFCLFVILCVIGSHRFGRLIKGSSMWTDIEQQQQQSQRQQQQQWQLWETKCLDLICLHTWAQFI